MFQAFVVVALALPNGFQAARPLPLSAWESAALASASMPPPSNMRNSSTIKLQKETEVAKRWWDGLRFFDLPENTCDMRRVDGPSWFAAQGCSGESCGGKMPQEPTIFTGLISGWPALNMTWDYSSLTSMFGDLELEFYEEWQQTGGNIHLLDVGERLKQRSDTGRLRQLVDMWKAGFMGEHEDFWCAERDDQGNDRAGIKEDQDNPSPSVSCNMSLCCQMKKKGLISVPKELDGDSFPTGQSFSLSPSGGGFAMHTHAGSWLGLVTGEKAWFVDHPDKIGPNRPWYYTVLPLISPARSFAKEVMDQPAGQRPQFCIQRPGEVAYIPDGWWHATLNRGDFALGFGTKPQWFHKEFTKNICGRGSHEYNCELPGDALAATSRNRQRTNIPQLMSKRDIDGIIAIANIAIKRAQEEIEQHPKMSQNFDGPGPNSRTAANLLCLMAKSLWDPGLQRNGSGLVHSWMNQAKVLDPRNKLCEELSDATVEI